MDINSKNITASYRERMQRLALFDPLYRLENKKTTDHSGRPIDYYSLGLLTLLFFFENMLVRNHKTGVRELARFLQTINQGELDLDDRGFEKLARDIIEVFRPPSGKRNARNFYNWETRSPDTVYYTILKADRFDTRTNSQYYSLDEDGLELVFATREYFSEFQVSINQLLLRKQLERGQFWGALRQIDEMRIAVESLQERITRMRHEIQRNIVSEQIYQRYRDTVEEIHLRLSREDREFEELQAFVRETRERLSYERRTAKDQQTYELVIRIDAELSQVHHQHGLLLRDSIEMKTTALQAAQESLYYAGIDSFNFQKEIGDRLLSTPLPLTAARQLLKPFLFLERKQTWSLLTVFAPQRLEGRRQAERNAEFLELLDEQQVMQEHQKLRQNYQYIAELILDSIGEENQTTLQEVVQYCRAHGYEQVLESRHFYEFWILLHQRAPLELRQIESEELAGLLGGVREVFSQRAAKVTVREKDPVLEVTDRYTIKDMELTLEAEGNVL
ncbi:MAG: replicative DNA helicase [Syntrophomonadaceae bacterium]|nr:replicative DNA helicase [Bacillota bacterium]